MMTAGVTLFLIMLAAMSSKFIALVLNGLEVIIGCSELGLDVLLVKSI
jgi:hypothetical protein